MNSMIIKVEDLNDRLLGEYEIDLDGVQTTRDAAWWIRHLKEKSWFNEEVEKETIKAFSVWLFEKSERKING